MALKQESYKWANKYALNVRHDLNVTLLEIINSPNKKK